jgi:monofunctional biosynthetic peptidoglycan transglycosylase
MKARLRRWAWRGLAIALGSQVVVVLLLRFVPVPMSAFMIEDRIGSIGDNRKRPAFAYDWTSWEHISTQAKLAVVAAEDQRFYEHSGFDFDAIGKAMQHNSRSRHVRGASTISQQVAKNLFLWPGRSWLRKGLEAWFTVLLETAWPKQRILEVYLNIAEFGDNTYGVEAAAQRFWHKPASALGAREAALLAAVLPNPQRFRAQAPSLYVQTRASWIVGQMRQLELP